MFNQKFLASAAGASTHRGWRASWFSPLLFAGLFFTTFSLSGSDAITTILQGSSPLDTSWQLALEYAAQHNLQFGTDILFTYGPLGFLLGAVGQGDFLLQRALFALPWSALVAWAGCGIARKVAAPLKYLFAAWLLLFCTYGGGVDTVGFIIMLYLAFRLLQSNLALPPSVLQVAVLALFAQTKFTFFPLAVGIVAVTALVRLREGKIFRAALLVAVFVAVFGALWVAMGQQPANILAWIRGSWEISSGYSKAMSRSAQPVVLALSLAAVGIFVVSLSARVKHLAGLADAGFLALLVLVDFMAWKQGFVRAYDHSHSYILFQPLGFILLNLRCQESQDNQGTVYATPVRRSVALFAVCLFALLSREKGDTFSDVVTRPYQAFQGVRLAYQMVTGSLRQHYLPLQQGIAGTDLDLPLARSLVGTATVDVLNFQQWTVLANKLNYRPRPVIQGYSAYTPYLEGLNLSYVESERRPKFLIFNQETIDERYPTLDDGDALPFILQNYQVCGKERGFLILKENQGEHRPLRLKLVHSTVLAPDQVLDLSPYNGKILLMRVETRPTLWGRLVTTLYHAPIIPMEASVGGEVLHYRYVPGLADKGFIVNPLLSDTKAVENFYQKKGSPVDAVWFKAPPMAAGQVQSKITVQLFQIEQ